MVVTMGCGDACPVIPGKRYIDWQLEDPKGKGSSACARFATRSRAGSICSSGARPDAGEEASDEVRLVRLHPKRRTLPDGAGVLRAVRAGATFAPSRPGRIPPRRSGPRSSRRCARSASTFPSGSRRRLDLEMQLHTDWAITLACAGSCPYVPSAAEDWDVADPRGRTLEQVREIRDEIERRVVDLVESDSMRSAPTGRRMKPGCGVSCRRSSRSSRARTPPRRFEPAPMRCSPPYDEAPVRSFALALAERETKARLREGACGPAGASR